MLYAYQKNFLLSASYHPLGPLNDIVLRAKIPYTSQ
jgi:hypothetical protein